VIDGSGVSVSIAGGDDAVTVTSVFGGDTDTVTTCGALFTPLDAVMVKVSVVEFVAA